MRRSITRWRQQCFIVDLRQILRNIDGQPVYSHCDYAAGKEKSEGSAKGNGAANTNCVNILGACRRESGVVADNAAIG